jgi:DHA3 family macrolide efflux protein-like MFS transporter
LRFLASQTLTLFGSSLVQYAIMWHITLRTQSGLMMALAIISGFLPTFFLAPFAGVWADRYNRKHIIMLADAMIAVATLVLAVLFLLGYQALWLLLAVSVVRALGTAVQSPAVGAFLPQVVPQDQLMRANGLLSTIQSMIMLVSPMVSGAMLTVASIEYVLLIDVVTAAVAISVFWGLEAAPHVKAAQAQATSYWNDIRLGLRYIGDSGYIRRFFVFSGCFFFLVAPAAFLTPLQVARTFGSDVWRLTAIEVVFSLGMLGGGLLVTTWGGFANRVRTMALSTAVVGVTTVMLGVVPYFWPYLAIMTVVGVAIPLYNTPANVLLQEKVEPEFLGRVFGVMTMISGGMMPLGMLVFGPLADVVSIESQLVLTGVVLTGQGVVMGTNRVLLAAGQPARPGGLVTTEGLENAGGLPPQGPAPAE